FLRTMMTFRTSMRTSRWTKKRWRSSARPDVLAGLIDAKKKAPSGAFFLTYTTTAAEAAEKYSGLDTQAFVALLELRHTATAVDQRLRATGPGRVGVRIDVELQRRAFFAPGGAGHVLGAVCHDDLDHVVVGMDVGLHHSVLILLFA